jgi:hypothetical protein
MDQPPAAVATDSPDALFAAASRLHEAGRLEEAKPVLHRLLAAQPAHIGGLNLLGITLGQQGDLAAACDLVERAIALAGEHPVYLRNLCELRRQNDEAPTAVLAGRRAITAAPSDRIARLNLAMAEQDALELDAAEANTRAVLATEPANGSAHFLLAQLALLRGHYAEGWREYAWRWRIPGAEQPKPPGEVPEWDGAALDGTLMLMGDQGFGDMIQFARFIPWAAARCAKLAICAPRDLRGLLTRFAPNAVFVADPAQVEAVAAHAAFSSLPGLAGAAEASIPAAEGYLTADPERVRRWSARLDQLAPKPNRRIGLVWAGRREHRADRQRSMPLAAFAPLFWLTGITFVSLQKGEAVGQVAGYFGPAPLVNLGPELEDFDATAAVLTCLDGLVTVDTSVAHLAGALGLRAEVLLPFRPDWRWLLGRTDTPWYRGLRLWRDAGPRGRGETVMRVREAI